MIDWNDEVPSALYSTTTSSPESAFSHVDAVPPICTINDKVLNKQLSKSLLSLLEGHLMLTVQCADPNLVF